MKDETVYITGHRHPDTDSIASAIAYAFYKKTQGIKAVPCRLGDLNQETKYLLDRFGFEEPLLLKDARKTLEEIDCDPPVSISEDTTFLETIRKMKECGRESLAVVDEENKMIGYVSKSDLANIALGDTAAEIELLKHTTVEEIAGTIDGRILYNCTDTHISGKVSIVALSEGGTMNYNVEDRIVIVGSDAAAQEELIRKGAGLLIIVWPNEVSEQVLQAAEEFHCPIILSGHGGMNTSRYLFFAPPVSLIMKKNPVVFRSDMYVEDAAKKMMQSRYRSYPVLDRQSHMMGYVSRFHVLNHANKRIILVDHNEFSQSVKAIEKAQILEVIDHHRINDFATTQPVSFRNEIIGSTATIIATIFRENQVLMPKELAGLLLGAILSDTLVFQSPTSTQKDREAAYLLAALADLDIDTFSKEMFTAAASGNGRSLREQIVQDIKYFEINGQHTMISQVFVSSVSEIRSREDEILREIEVLREKKELDVIVVAFTSIIDEGSVFFSNRDFSEKLLEAFPDQPGEKHSLQKNILSRKSQILPSVTSVLE